MVIAEVDVNNRYEYKTVHARRGEFGDPAHLHRLLQQEALAGWVIVEPFTANAACFRRPKQARAWDHRRPPGVAPYRTLYTYDAEPDIQLETMLILGATVLVTLMLVVGLVLLFCA